METPTLSKPSDQLQAALKTELSKPEYQGMDPDEAYIEAGTALFKTRPETFDPLNETDRILRMLAASQSQEKETA